MASYMNLLDSDDEQLIINSISNKTDKNEFVDLEKLHELQFEFEIEKNKLI